MKLKLSPGDTATASFEKLIAEARAIDFELTATRADLVRDRFYAVQTTAQTFADGVLTTVVHNAIRLDAAGMQTNAGTVRIPTTGQYAISAHINFVGNATGRRLLRITSREKGALADQGMAPGSANTMALSVYIACVPLNKGDIISVGAFQNSGGNLNSNPNGDHFSVVRL